MTRDPPAAAPLVFRGRLSEDDLIAIQRCCDLVTIRPAVRWLARGFAALLLALTGAMVWQRGWEMSSALLAFGTSYVFVYPFEREWMIRRRYRKCAGEMFETQVTVSPDELTVVNEAQTARFDWRVVGAVIDAPAGVAVLNKAGMSIFWLPARILDDDTRTQLLGMAGANGVRLILQ